MIQSGSPIIMSKFVIVGVQRTGTTLVRTTLDSHPEIICFGEAFVAASGLWVRKERGAMDELWQRGNLSYSGYVTDSALRRLGHIAWRDRLVRSYLDWFYSQEGAHATGFKFMFNHMRGFPTVVPYILEKNIRVIHVLRENVFDTYLSRVTMKARGFAHSTRDVVQQVKVYIPVDTLTGELVNIQQAGEQWARVFQKDVPYLRVCYEDFVTDRVAQMDRATEFLGVDRGVPLRSNLKKLNKSKLSDTIENLDEVRRCLEGTAFAWCLDGRE